MSHFLRVLVAVSVLAVPGVALADCTKDTDCKGDRVCERGTCITPGERAPPAKPEYTAPPPPPRVEPPAARSPRQRPAPGVEGSWETRSRKNVLAYNLFSTLYGFYAAFSLQAGDPGLTIWQFTFVYERALLPNLSLTASLTPNFWTDQAGTLPYVGITVGARYYAFGDAPAGFWAGGELGTLALNIGPGVALEGGYQWLLDSGLMLGLAGGITFAGAEPPQIGIAFGLGVGGHVGWNF